MIKRIIFFLLTIGFIMLPAGVTAQETPAPVRAVLFFSPTCPHCHVVMEEILPPLQETYGEQLEILEIDVSLEAGANLYQNYLVQFQIPDNRRGVPALVVGDTVLVGSQEIPDIFPGIIAANLEQGLNWPAIPGLSLFLAEPADASSTEVQNSGLWLAWGGLIMLFAALVFTAWRVGSNPHLHGSIPAGQPIWLIPALAVVGLFISGYLTIVELGQTEAVCGPVGDCNAVQSSSYATIGGVPIALLGLIFYLAVGVLWLIWPRLKMEHQQPAGWSLFFLAIIGVIFSIYLTAVEILVLQAVCAWCVASAIISAVMLALITLAFFPDSVELREEKRKARHRVAH